MKTREEMITDCQGLVRSLAWQIHCKLPSHVDLEDLVAYGQIGLLEAARAYDPTRENQFSTYSYYRIRGAILDGLSKMAWFNRASFLGGDYERQKLAANRPAIPEPRPEQTPEQLIADSQGLVRSLAWQVHRKLPSHVDLNEIIALGQKGLEAAAREHRTATSGQFSTRCYSLIQNAILDGLSKKSWFNRTDYYGGVYEQQADGPTDLPQPSEQDSSPAETPSYFDPDKVASLVTSICRKFGTGDTDPADEDESGQPAPVDVAMQREMVEKLHELIQALPESAQVLIRATYFDGLTLKDAGELLGKSKAWASRLHAKTLDQLAQSFRGSRMAD